jgi:hypothetical protein
VNPHLPPAFQIQQLRAEVEQRDKTIAQLTRALAHANARANAAEIARAAAQKVLRDYPSARPAIVAPAGAGEP